VARVEAAVPQIVCFLSHEELGEYNMKSWEDGIANVIRAVKVDETSLELQNQFYRDAEHPLDTKQ
jgi:creatinine amidohydrolase